MFRAWKRRVLYGLRAVFNALLINSLLLTFILPLLLWTCLHPDVVGFRCNYHLMRRFSASASDEDERIAFANQDRLEKADKALEERGGIFAEAHQDCTEKLVVGIIASNRDYPSGEKFDYLTQVSGEVLRQADPDSVIPFICNVEAVKLAEADYLGQFLRIVSVRASWNQTSNALRRKLWKEAEDYVRCLRKSVDLCGDGAGGVLLLEDDAYPQPGLLESAQSILRLHNSKGTAFVKLYHPERLRKLPWIIQAIALALIVALSTTYAMHRFLSRKQLDFLNLIFQLLLWSGIFLALGHDFFATARSCVTGPYLTLPESCCTPAVLFPMNSVPAVISFLTESVGQGIAKDLYFAKDDLLDILPGKLGLRAYQSDTNLVLHIGGYSSLRDFPVSPDA